LLLREDCQHEIARTISIHAFFAAIFLGRAWIEAKNAGHVNTNKNKREDF
jgi:hypothetical protein